MGRNRDFRLLWIGETTSRLGSNVTTVALPLVAVVTLHAGTFAVGALSAAVWLPWLVIGLPAGAWVDRLPRRPVMLVCDAVSAVLFVSVPVAAWLGVLSLAQLLVVAVLTGAAGVFFFTAYRVYLPSLVDQDELAGAIGKTGSSESAAQLVGRALGGVLAQWFGAVLSLLADPVTFLVSAVCLVSIRSKETAVPQRIPGHSLRRDIGEGLRWLRRDPYLRGLALFGGVGNLGLTGYAALQVVFLVRVIGVSASAVGALVAVTGAGGVVGALLVTRITRRWGTARGLVWTLGFTLPFGLLIPLSGNGFRLLFLIVGGFVTGAGVVAANVIAGTFRQVYCPARLRGRVVASSALISNGAGPLGALLAGALGAAIGVRPTVWVMMGILLCAGLIVLAGPIRHGRELPATPESDWRDSGPVPDRTGG